MPPAEQRKVQAAKRVFPPASTPLRPLAVPVPLAVNATAILLTVEAHGLGLDDPFTPAPAEIFVIEFHAVLGPHLPPDAGDEVMLLVFAVQKGGRKRTKSLLP